MNAAAVAWFGDRAVVVRMSDPQERRALLTALRERFREHDVRVGMDSVMVVSAEPDARLLGTVTEWLAAAAVDPTVGGVPLTTIDIPVVYDGEDLHQAAASLGCDARTLVDAHSRQTWSVALMGFAPGFGYLVPTGDLLLPWSQVPRLDRPRSRVPGGSVAVAAGMSAVYPSAMPGGWLLLGTTEVTLFDPSDEASPTLLRPGHRVRFVEEAP